MRARSLAAVTIAFAVVACTDATMPVATGLVGPSFSISDGAHSGNSFFNFLPPMVANPGSGTNVTGLAPVVDICAWDGSACTTSLAHFTTDLSTTTTTQPGNSETVRQGGDHYIVNWHTAAFNLDVAVTYRICVSVGSQALGHADVDVVGSGKDLKNVNSNEFVGLLDDRTLPIKFRIQDGAVGQPADPGCGGGGLGTISGHKYYDLGGGTLVLAQDWQITLSGPVTKAMLTLGDGTYSFTGLPPGDYTVCEQSKAGVPQESPTTGPDCGNGTYGYPITIGPDQMVWENIDFVNDNSAG
jgi:hypothetical protein